LAGTMNEAVVLAVEVDRARIERRLATGYCDRMETDLDAALQAIQRARDDGTPLSIALLGNAADVYPEMVKRRVAPDLVTDQTSAHDNLNGYVPNGMSYDEALSLRRTDPVQYIEMSMRAMARQVRAMLD